MTSVAHNPSPRGGAGRAIFGALGFGVLLTAVAVVGAFAASSATERYSALRQPEWAPPSWLFSPLWTVLYVLIALAGWKLWWSAGSLMAVRGELLLYGVGLVLNGAWTPLFFAADLRSVALVEIVVLDLVTVATIVVFTRRDRVAAGLFAPYLLWILFATALNAAVVALN